MKRFTDEKNEERKAFLRVNVAASAIDVGRAIDERLSSMIQMKNIEILLDDKVTVNFDPKTYDPTIYLNNKKSAPAKKILLLSMFLKDYRVLEVNTEDTFVLETLSKDEFFGMVISFNTDKANLSFTAYNEKTRTLDTHIFTIVNGMISYEKITSRNTEPDSLHEKRPRKFKPARITQAILVSKDDETSLAKLTEYKENEAKFDKILIDLADATQILPGMKEAGYKAATLFVPSNLITEQNEKYEIFIRDAKKYFRVFFTVSSEGKIVKVKVN